MSSFQSKGSSSDGTGPDQQVFPCNTCQAVFSSIEKVKSHYRGDWHILNSKRRGHALPPLSKAEFKSLEGRSSSASSSSKKTSSAKTSSPMKSSPSKSSKTTSVVSPDNGTSNIVEEAEVKDSSVSTEEESGVNSMITAGLKEGGQDDNAAASGSNGGKEEIPLYWGGITAQSEEELRETARQMGVGSERLEKIVKMAMSRKEAETMAVKDYRRKKREAFLRSTNASEDEIVEALKELDVATEAADANEKESSDTAGTTVGEKEEGEGEEECNTDATSSIFDNEEFETVNECVQYMRDTYGFYIPDKEALSDLDGLLEYLNEKVKIGNFCLYCQRQFRTREACHRHMIDKSHCKLAYEEGVDYDEYEDFYDFDLIEEYRNLPRDENGDIVEKVAYTNEIGELVLPSGKVLGHRQYKVYYKQRLPMIDNRPSVVAVQREELRRLGYEIGHDFTEEQIVAMPDMQVMELVVKHQTRRRRELALQQRARYKAEMRAKRNDGKMKMSQLRANEQKNQIIRDYHGRLQ
jgi:hypothetical protein